MVIIEVVSSDDDEESKDEQITSERSHGKLLLQQAPVPKPARKTPPGPLKPPDDRAHSRPIRADVNTTEESVGTDDDGESDVGRHDHLASNPIFGSPEAQEQALSDSEGEEGPPPPPFVESEGGGLCSESDHSGNESNHGTAHEQLDAGSPITSGSIHKSDGDGAEVVGLSQGPGNGLEIDVKPSSPTQQEEAGHRHHRQRSQHRQPPVDSEPLQPQHARVGASSSMCHSSPGPPAAEVTATGSSKERPCFWVTVGGSCYTRPGHADLTPQTCAVL